MQPGSFATDKQPTNWPALRPAVGIAFLVCEIVGLVVAPHNTLISTLLGNTAFATIGLSAAAMAYRSALNFSPRQTARRAWMIIAFMPVADVIAFTAHSLPVYFGHGKNAVFIGVATTLLSLSRLFAAAAFLSMVRVYRRTGVPLNLRGSDYLAMGCITVMEVVGLVLVRSMASTSAGPQLQKLALITGIPLVVALVPCSVFGVMIWRYTAEMGGGLIAKAWRCTLSYGVLWLAYITLLAIVGQYVAASPAGTSSIPKYLITVVATRWLLKGSEYLIFLGSSYQYEACTSVPDFALQASPSAVGVDVDVDVV
jgi:hypothetical protein